MSKINWEYDSGVLFTTGAERVYVNKKLKVEKRIYTRCDSSGCIWGEGKVTYSIDGDPRTFKSEDELLEQLGSEEP